MKKKLSQDENLAQMYILEPKNLFQSLKKTHNRYGNTTIEQRTYRSYLDGVSQTYSTKPLQA